MAGTIKGMTIEIGGNTAPLEQALKNVNKEIKGTQTELKQVDKLLKLDPKNVELLKQKQQLLGDQITTTKTKLDALKQAQKQLDAEISKGGNVNQEEYRKLQREILTTESSLKKLKETNKENNKELASAKLHLTDLANGFKKVGEAVAPTVKAITNFTVAGVKAMAGATTTAVTALGTMAVKAGQLADDLNTMASVTGLSTKELQEFAYASDLIDVSTDTLASSLKKLTMNMSSAKDGTGSQAEAFKKLGINIKDSQGNLRNSNEVFNETIRALGGIANETERDALAMQIFGKSATELNPLIEGGIDTLERMSKQANELGLILSQEALDGANAFNDQLDILKANGKQTFQVIGTEIASQLAPAMEELNNYTMDVIKSLTSAMETGGLEGLAEELSNQIRTTPSKSSRKASRSSRARNENRQKTSRSTKTKRFTNRKCRSKPNNNASRGILYKSSGYNTNSINSIRLIHNSTSGAISYAISSYIPRHEGRSTSSTRQSAFDNRRSNDANRNDNIYANRSGKPRNDYRRIYNFTSCSSRADL